MQQCAVEKEKFAILGIHASLQPLFWRYDHLLEQMHLTVQMWAAAYTEFTFSSLRLMQIATLATDSSQAPPFC